MGRPTPKNPMRQLLCDEVVLFPLRLDMAGDLRS